MTVTPSVAVQLVIVPGAFAGAGTWTAVAERLGAAGVAAQVVDLPTTGEDAGQATFASDVAAVTAVLDALEGPVVLAAHSYGGAVVTAAAAGPHPNVRELVYVAAAAPASGESMASTSAAAAQAAGQGEDSPGPAPREDGLLVFPPEVARQALFNDCDDERAQAGLDQLQPQSMAGTDTPIPVAAWTHLPSVYVRAEQDLVPRALGDGFLDRAEVVEIDTGHCPHWSTPGALADLLEARVSDRYGYSE